MKGRRTAPTALSAKKGVYGVWTDVVPSARGLAQGSSNQMAIENGTPT